MSLNIVTTAPTKVRTAIRINAADVIAFVASKLAEQDENDVGLPDGSTLFLVTATSEDGKVKRQAIRANAENGTDMFLEVPFFQNADGTRNAIGGRARTANAETTDADA